MRQIICLVLLVTLALLLNAQAGSGADAGPASRAATGLGDVVFQARFADTAATQPWSQAKFAAWVPARGVAALRVHVPPAEARDTHMVWRTIDLTPFRGCQLYLQCQAKAEDVSKPAQPYNGVKYMLHFTTPATGPHWANQDNVYGSFDWTKIGFSVTIPADANTGTLHLGLQDSSGTACFDDLQIKVVLKPQPRPAPQANPGPVFRGHDLPRLRGVMSPTAFREDDVRVLGEEWKANLIRWQIVRNWGKPGTDRDLAEYDRWIDGKLDELDKVLESCRSHGIKVVIDLHSPPGGRRENSDLALCFEQQYRDHFVALWEKIARRCKGRPAIWGYDLVNEPVQNEPSPEGVEDYLGAQARAARAIRAIDPETPIFIEATQWDSADGFVFLKPLDVPNIVYQVHMYWPGQFTHQGVNGPAVGMNYPGEFAGQKFDKEALRRHLQPVRDFQLAHNVHIYAGEFSAIRWAPGQSAAQYLRDCIDLFEEYGWDWSYHAYREWDGWSVEHGIDPKDKQPTTQPSDRKTLLLNWFARNKRPSN